MKNNLETLIKLGRYNFVNDYINSTNFPEETIRGEIEIFDPQRDFSYEEGHILLKEKGLEPANAWELIEYGSRNFDNSSDNPFVLAFGTIWQDPDRDRRVVSLDRSPKHRELYLDYPDFRFNDHCVLAGVRPRKQSSKTLSLQAMAWKCLVTTYLSRLLIFGRYFSKTPKHWENS